MSQPLDQKPVIRKASTYFGICLLAFTLVALLSYYCLTLFPGNSANTHQLVAKFTGKDTATAGTFEVDDEWEIRWHHHGHLLSILWQKEGAEPNSIVEMPGKPIRAKGGVNNFKGGKYTVSVEGTGDWTIEIYQF